MQLMADGLAGHEMDFFGIVKDNPWLGGNTEYSSLNEGLPYWMNGLVALSYGLDDDSLKQEVLAAHDYVLSHQNQTTGWIGPETTYDSNNLWGRFPMALALMQLADAEPSTTDGIVDALYKFVPLMNALLQDGKSDDEQWGRARYADMTIVLQWLYASHPRSNASSLLIETMTRLQDHGVDWPGFYSKQSFPFQDLDLLPVSVTDPLFPYLHAVNVGQGLKAAGVDYRYNSNSSLLQTSRDAVSWILQYHGAASGTILGDERIAGLAPYRGSELCTTVETMYSVSYLHHLLGDASMAEAAERLAFNALPVAMTPDHWAHQYIELPNQPWSTQNTEANGLWWNVGQDGPTFGVEPNYPCCAVNHPQGYPKFLAASYSLHGDSGLAHTILAPASVNTTLPSGAQVSVACDTTYPFGTTLTYTITASAPFTLVLRVPTWSGSKNVQLNGAQPESAPVFDPATNTLAVAIPAGDITVLYSVAPTLVTEPRANDTIAVYHGALLYAIDIGQTMNSTSPDTDNAPTSADTVFYTNTKAWNIAIDPSTLTYNAGYDANVSSSSSNGADPEKTLPNPLWAYQAPPSYVTGKGCLIKWDVSHDYPAQVPLDGNRECQGGEINVVMRPYGSLRSRMTELPTVSLGSGYSTMRREVVGGGARRR